MSDINEEQKRLYKRAEENDLLREIEEYKEIEKYFIKENKELQNRINKATKLLLDKYVRGLLNDNEVNNIVKILKGDDKE